MDSVPMNGHALAHASNGHAVTVEAVTRCLVLADEKEMLALARVIDADEGVAIERLADVEERPQDYALLEIDLLCRRLGPAQIRIGLALGAKLLAQGSTLYLTALPGWEKDQPLSDYLASEIGRSCLGDRALDRIRAFRLPFDALRLLAPKGHAEPKRPGNEEEFEVFIPDWPEPPDPCVYHGLAGRIALRIEPETEADPLAILVQILIGFGSAIGTTAHYRISATRHYLNEYAVIVGDSAIARKGTGEDLAREVMKQADKRWYGANIRSGLSTSEGLIKLVRDDLHGHERKVKGRGTTFQETIIEKGVEDKRLLMIESEFSAVLRRLEREGNTLSMEICRAFDHKTLGNASVKCPYTATDPHISIIGHIPIDTLKGLLKASEAVSGFANRFMWILTRSEKDLPFGGNALDMSLYADALADAIARAKATGEMQFDADARDLWDASYKGMKARYRQVPGLLGHVLGRGPTHCLRLAMLFSLLEPARRELKSVITRTGLEAALALWDYAERSATYIFGDTLGNPNAERILEALKAKCPLGLTRTEISEIWKGRRPAALIARDLALLLRNSLVYREVEPTTGRPRETWYYSSGVKSGEKGSKGGAETQNGGFSPFSDLFTPRAGEGSGGAYSGAENGGIGKLGNGPATVSQGVNAVAITAGSAPSSEPPAVAVEAIPNGPWWDFHTPASAAPTVPGDDAQGGPQTPHVGPEAVPAATDATTPVDAS